ncbi:MAG: ABC transporter ATP-binding protein [Acidobacteriota bacterium]|nr:ABC transporter ATP-binding protein [Acidobacteriota bacterium]
MTPLLDLRITVDYPNKPSALRDLALWLEPGETLGLAGESGSGKSTLALAILGLLQHKGGRVSGEIQFDGRDLVRLSNREFRRVRGREIALVPQSPLASLNPAMRIGAQIEEAWKAHRKDGGWKHRAQELFPLVRLPAGDDFLSRYPRQLSVGQGQRVLIAMAVLHSPRLLIADEPTSALDAITQAEILDLFARLNREMGTAILFISHDLESVAALCDRIAVLHHGQVVEQGPTAGVFEHPQHEYTRALLDARPGWRVRNSVSA